MMGPEMVLHARVVVFLSFLFLSVLRCGLLLWRQLLCLSCLFLWYDFLYLRWLLPCSGRVGLGDSHDRKVSSRYPKLIELGASSLVVGKHVVVCLYSCSCHCGGSVTHVVYRLFPFFSVFIPILICFLPGFLFFLIIGVVILISVAFLFVLFFFVILVIDFLVTHSAGLSKDGLQ